MNGPRHICCGLALFLSFVVVPALEVATPIHAPSSGRRSHSALSLISLSLDKWGSKSLGVEQPFDASTSSDTLLKAHSSSNHLAASISSLRVRASSTSSLVLIATLVVWVFIVLVLLAGPWGNDDGPNKSPRSARAETTYPPSNAKLRASDDSFMVPRLPPDDGGITRIRTPPSSAKRGVPASDEDFRLPASNAKRGIEASDDDFMLPANNAKRGILASEESLAKLQASDQPFVFNDRVYEDPRQEAITLLVKCNIVSKQELESDHVSQEHLAECVVIANQMLQLKPVEEWVTLSQYGPQSFQDTVSAIFEARENARNAISEARDNPDAYDFPSEVPASGPSMPPSVPVSANSLQKDSSQVSLGQVSFGHDEQPQDTYVGSQQLMPSTMGSVVSFGHEERVNIPISYGSAVSFGHEDASVGAHVPVSVGSLQKESYGSVVSFGNEESGRRSYMPPGGMPMSFKSPVPVLNCYNPMALPSSGELEQASIPSQPASGASLNDVAGGAGGFASVFSSPDTQQVASPETPQVSPQEPQKAPDPQPHERISPRSLLRLPSQEIMTVAPAGWTMVEPPPPQDAQYNRPATSLRLAARETLAVDPTASTARMQTAPDLSVHSERGDISGTMGTP